MKSPLYGFFIYSLNDPICLWQKYNEKCKKVQKASFMAVRCRELWFQFLWVFTQWDKKVYTWIAMEGRRDRTNLPSSKKIEIY
jgi:hypothetical protein